MTKANRWLLPDGVDEMLPPRARELETLRREILDLYGTWGFELVMTPLIEFLDSLLIVPSNALQLQTFKLVDQLSGREMGVRADITSQVARIDAHVLQRDVPARLCYSGSVLHTRPQSLLGSRSPFMIGAELYGHGGIEGDIEVISLMLKSLGIAGIDNPTLSLGHVNIYRTLIGDAGLGEESQAKVFAALQRKSTDEIEQLLAQSGADAVLIDNLKQLSRLTGDAGVLDQAAHALKSDSPGVSESLEQLRRVADAITRRFPDQDLYFDLGELRGYDYHTGVVFAAYVSGHGEAIANGGRYDDIGKAFGRARAATGFDTDLKLLLSQGSREFPAPRRIFAPANGDPALADAIDALRRDGEQVVCGFPGRDENAADLDCEFHLVNSAGNWQVQPI